MFIFQVLPKFAFKKFNLVYLDTKQNLLQNNKKIKKLKGLINSYIYQWFHL